MLAALEEAALRTFLLAAVVQLGLWVLRIRQARLLALAWTVVLAASLAMPTLQWATPLRLPILPAVFSASLADAAAPPGQAAATQAPNLAVSADIDEAPVPWLSLDAIYRLISGALLLRLIVGVALSLRLLGRAVPVRMGWAAGANVRISRDVSAPVTVATVILLPADAMGWPAAMREAVMAHERAHVAHWDFAMLLASQVNRALFWFSPLSWWLNRRLAVLAELASDDMAMQATGDRHGYAGVLLEMGRRSGPVLRGLAMARPATLRYRIERILSDRVRLDPASPFQQVILAIGAVSLSIAAASPHSNPGPPLDLAAPAGQRQPSGTAELVLLPQTQAMEDVPEPMLVPPPAAAFAFLAPAVQAVVPLASSVVGAAARPIPRPKTRNTTVAILARSLVPHVRRVNDQGARERSLRAASVIVSAAVPQIKQPASDPPLFKQADEPLCTGVYIPRPERPLADRSLDLIQAKYFRAADGTSWVRFFVGERTRAMLTGREVERTSVRTTVVAILPKGTDYPSGTTHGPYGSIEFECKGSNAHI